MNCRYTSSAFVAAAFLMMAHSATAQNNDKLLAANGTTKTTYASHYTVLPKIAFNDITKLTRVWKEVNHGTESGPSKVYNFFERNTSLADVLANGVKEGKFAAYSNENDRFTRALTTEELSAVFTKTADKNPEITGYQIKEDSIWTNAGEVTVRIIGIAPMGRITGADGAVKEQPLFWIFYPDCREYLASKPFMGADGWYDFFERQYFTGMVTKVTEHPKFQTYESLPSGK